MKKCNRCKKFIWFWRRKYYRLEFPWGNWYHKDCMYLTIQEEFTKVYEDLPTYYEELFNIR